MIGLGLRGVSITGQRSLTARAISAIRRNNGTLIGIPDNFAGAYIDSTGTQPVTAVGDVLGLLTDRSYGAGNLGPELFSYVSGDAGVSHNAGVITFSAVPTNSGATGAITLSTGKSYKVTFTVTGFTAGGVSIKSGTGGMAGVAAAANGTFTEVFSPTTSVGALQFVARYATSTLTVSNITVREVLGNHATQPTTASKPVVTRVPKRLGPEMVVNGTFDADAAWTKGDGWTITGGSAVRVPSSFGSVVSQPVALIPGKTYITNFTVSAFAAGTARIAFFGGTNIYGAFRGANGAYTETLTAVTGNNTLGVVGSNTANLSIDNIEVREVLEWTNAISFDGSNDFLQTGITTGNEGWVCAGVTFQSTAVQAIFGSGGNASSTPGVMLFLSAGSMRLACGSPTVSTTYVGGTAPAVGVPSVCSAGWGGGNALIGVNNTEVLTALTDTIGTSIGLTNIGASKSGFSNLHGPMPAIVYTPVLPSASDRALIRKWVRSLQGQTL